MKTKKVEKLMMQAAQQAGRECMKYANIPMPASVEDEMSTAEEGKDVLELKMEEAAKNANLRQRQKLMFAEDQYEVLNQYKKELDKERKARKKAEERQKEMMYVIKDFSRQLHEMEKRYQEQGKEIEKKYQKLKTNVRKRARKQKEEISLMKGILKALAYKLHISHCGASIKEIAKDSRKKVKKMS